MDTPVKLDELRQVSGQGQLGRESIITKQERDRDADLPRIYAVLPNWLQWLYLMDWFFRWDLGIFRLSSPPKIEG